AIVNSVRQWVEQGRILILQEGLRVDPDISSVLGSSELFWNKIATGLIMSGRFNADDLNLTISNFNAQDQPSSSVVCKCKDPIQYIRDCFKRPVLLWGRCLMLWDGVCIDALSASGSPGALMNSAVSISASGLGGTGGGGSCGCEASDDCKQP